MDEEQRDMKAHKAYYQRVDFVSNSLQGIPQLCPCGSIMKEIVDEEDTYDYLPGKRYFICKDIEDDGLHYRQPWVIGVQEEVERLKLKVLRHENLLRECEALKEQVKMLVKRVSELENRLGLFSFSFLLWLFAVIVSIRGSEMDEEQRDMKAHKAYYQRVDFVSNSLQGILQLCPCGSITKEIVDEEDTYDYFPGKRYFICKDFENDGLHYRQPWVIGVQEEVERLKLKVLRHENLLRECEALKEQVKMLVNRVSEHEAALDIFNSDQNMKFKLEHAWRELRHDVKWCSTYLEKDKDKRKTADTPVAEPEDRPIGVKAAKAAGKRKKT
ncbi:hypothetical protein F2Q70_00008323 [Brassica cretica]|uniref:Zinc finger GRF-type domain-containing protein n=1 Tax=Brassica cretica TaxID=69181 RepID=A0A8S9M235_BRACR|nr:hypothetical protein F2Q70_00008323 [Brassica cretica]